MPIRGEPHPNIVIELQSLQGDYPVSFQYISMLSSSKLLVTNAN